MLAKKEACQKYSNVLIIVVTLMAIIIDGTLYSSLVPLMPEYIKLWSTKHCRNGTDALQQISSNSSEMFLKTEIPNYSSALIKTSTVLSNATISKKNRTQICIFPKIPQVLIGILFAMQPALQTAFGPIVAPLIKKFGSLVVLFIGNTSVMIASGILIMTQNYYVVLVSKVVHGAAGAMVMTSSMVVMTQTFTDKSKRVMAISMVTTGYQVSANLGAMISGTLFNVGDFYLPYSIITILALVCSLLMTPLYFLKRDIKPTASTGNESMLGLIKDPYILILITASTFSMWLLSYFESVVGVWMKSKFDVLAWRIGLIFVPAVITELTASFSIVMLYKYTSRASWCFIGTGSIIAAGGQIMFRFAGIYSLAMLGYAITNYGTSFLTTATVDQAIYTSELRHANSNEDACALVQTTLMIGTTIGPLIGGVISDAMGIGNTLLTTSVVMSLIGLVSFPIIYKLFKFTTKIDEHTELLHKTSTQMSNN